MTSNNLSQFFQQASNNNSTNSLGSYNKHSKAVSAKDDEHFNDTTFQLKRTRSVGLLDEFIAPTRKLIEEDQEMNILDNDNDDDDDNQFIENIEDQAEKPIKPSKLNMLYCDEDDEYFEQHEKHNDENSPSLTPEHFQPHDDNDIKYEPSRHVDYLSHDWKESDISKSWRYIVLKRKDVANSARLENASWRTWAQAKYHLKTVSPESVNWLKDSDVTWLYGPLYKEPTSNDARGYGSDIDTNTLSMKPKKKKQVKRKGPKPILKKRTVTEMLSQPLHHPGTSTSVPVSPPHFEEDFDLISKKVNAQYANSNLKNSSSPTAKGSLVSPLALQPEPPAKRHIHFNDRVEQCIALAFPDSDEEQEYHDDRHKDNQYDDGHVNADASSDADNDDDDSDDNDDDSDDEGGFFLMVKSPSSTQLHVTSQIAMNSLQDSDDTKSGSDSTQGVIFQSKPIQTIEWLPATTLKNCSDDEEDEKFALSHNTNTSRGYNYHYDYNSVFIGNEAQCNAFLDANQFDYENTPQHLEGVSMVDVPEDIVLGSNVEILDAPDFAHEDAPVPPQFIDPTVRSNGSGGSTPVQPPIIGPSHSQHSSGIIRNRSNSNFHFDHSDSESDSEEEIPSQPFNSTPFSNPSTSSSTGSKTSNLNDNLTKMSSSPSYASLSDVAAHGYFALSSTPPNSNNLSNVLGSGNSSITGSPMNELEKEFGKSNIGHHEEDSSTDSEDEEGKTKPLGFGFLKNWKK